MSSLTKLANLPSVSLEHHFGAPPADVYRAWVEPHLLTMWFGPAGAVVLGAECDVRAGGRFHIHYRAPDGEEHEVSGAYREVIPAELLAFTWVWNRMPDQESLVTVQLAPEDEGTRLSLTHEQLPTAGAHDYLRMGWASALDKLESYLAEQTASDAPTEEVRP